MEQSQFDALISLAKIAIYPQSQPVHTILSIRNKQYKFEHIGKVIFDIPFMIESHAESKNKIMGAL